MEHVRGSARLLASVTNDREARLVASLGADVIDAKNPSAGALGALPAAMVTAIRAAVPAHIPVSATIGDPTDDIAATTDAIARMAATGADIVKIGLQANATTATMLQAVAKLDLGSARLVGVMLADKGVDFDLIPVARDAGFVGLMLDTADKRRGALPDVTSIDVLRRFVAATKAAGMFAGLAGSLRAAHVPQLLALSPDILGFRGGLCRQGDRTSEIDAEAVRAVRRIIPVCDAAQGQACRPLLLGAMAPRQAKDVA